MKKTKIYFPLIILLYITFLSFFHMNEIMTLTLQTKNQVINQLFPTLFPFMLMITICQKIGIIQLLGYLLQFISVPLFNISGNCLSIYLFSILSGYPTNAKMIYNAFSLNQITKQESDLLVKCAHHSSLSFVFFFIGIQLFNSIKIGILLEICHLLPTFLYLILSKKNKATYQKWCTSWYTYSSNIYNHQLFNIIKTSLKECLIAFTYIFGFMLICKISLISLRHLFNENLLMHLAGYLEFSSGTIQLVQYQPQLMIQLLMILSYISFGGVSVFLQVYQLLDTSAINFKNYLFFRIYHALFSTLLLFIYLIY